MSSTHHILSRALQDRFQVLANPLKLAQDFTDTLRKLVSGANSAFEDGDHSVGGSWHYIMDMDEASPASPLRPDGANMMAVYLNIHDTCKSDLRRHFAPLPEPALLLAFHRDGKVVGTTSRVPLEEGTKKIKAARSETLRVTNQNGMEQFVASWLRSNFNAKTLVAIQDHLDRADEKEARETALWNPQQRVRLLGF